MIASLKDNISAALQHQGFQRYFKNTSWLFGEQVLRISVSLLVGVWVARFLGPERFGLFSYAVAFASIFGSMAKVGLDSILVRDLIKNPDSTKIYLGTSFWLKVIGSATSLIIAAIASWLTERDPTTRLYILLITASFLFQPFEVIDFFFQSRVQSKFVSLCRIFQNLLSAILKVYLILTNANLVWFVAILIIDQISLASALYVAYRLRGGDRFYGNFDTQIAKRLLRDSYPLILAGIFLMIQARIDQVMLKTLIGNRELGYYSAALRLIEALGFLPTIFVGSLFPAIINSKGSSQELYEIRLSQLYRLMMAIFLISATPIFLFGNWIISIVYKSAFASAGPLLSLMSSRLLLTNFGVARNAYLTAENRTGYALITMIVGAILNASLNFLLIPKYQGNGAIFAALISFTFSTFLIDFLHPPNQKNAARMLKALFFA